MGCSKDLKAPDAPPSACAWKRRDFLQWLAAGAGVAILGGCGGSHEKPAPGTSANPIAAIATGADWKIAGAGNLKAGQALAFVLPDGSPGLVFLTPDGKLRALSTTCTHTGCTVEWQNSTEHKTAELQCPCHGSKFALDGKVLNGPAEEPLATYAARKAGADVLVKTQA